MRSSEQAIVLFAFFALNASLMEIHMAATLGVTDVPLSCKEVELEERPQLCLLYFVLLLLCERSRCFVNVVVAWLGFFFDHEIEKAGIKGNNVGLFTPLQAQSAVYIVTRLECRIICG